MREYSVLYDRDNGSYNVIYRDMAHPNIWITYQKDVMQEAAEVLVEALNARQ